MFLLVAAFVTKDFYSKFLTLVGEYSYEIYLIQWPIMYRYDFLYKNLPASLATVLYIFVFIGIGIVIKTICKMAYQKQPL
jgi:peptidoglycan/LPS O-acetylase OafA/YrhL